MKRTLILTLAALTVAVALCAASMLLVNDTVAKALELQSLSVLAARQGEADRAMELTVRLAEHWRERSGWMETLTGHDALHEVSRAIAEAQICLECGDHDDFLRTMSAAEAALNHLKEEESITWSNLY